ncbi:hypothetical protein CC78DRAFT_506893 [Lojkania enalia]|uniref:Integral membrane protein-like protein n=1 Tax=Lojkania enalia TaxID=147567 RepID=A0A9P4TR95_9PLEO|nr:hypothetical protein CC78DRAFT_506893 [Didymosphaeria enalia]
MRPTAVIPALCCAVALVLSFLCLFAGHKKGFMEDYHMLTLNTSQLGTNLLNSSILDSLPLPDDVRNVFDTVQDQFGDEVNDVVLQVADSLGVADFYSAHLLDYCWGDYVPTPLPNATVSSDAIHKNLTACSPAKAMFYFNPNEIIERTLNESGVDVTLDDLQWPDDIQTGIDALRIIQRTAFVLYCIAIALIGISLLVSAAALFTSGRLSACLNVMVSVLAFLAIGLASALVTAVIVKGGDLINEYGDEIGLEAHKGSKFMAITWGATAAMLVALVDWCLETCIGHRRRKHAYSGVPKHG